MHWSAIILLTYVLLFGLGTLVFVVNSIQEKEKRAVVVGSALLVGLALIGAGLWFMYRQGGLAEGTVAIYAVDALITGGIILILLPAGRNPDAAKGSDYYVAGPVKRSDECDIIFSRIRALRPGHPNYESYYDRRPERKDSDDQRREMGPAMGRVVGKIDAHNHLNVATLRALHPFPLLLGRESIVKPTPKGAPRDDDPAELTKFVKGLAKYLGADLVGIAKLDQRWVYSHRGEIFFGNDDDWGKEIHLDHPFAIVIATEMDREMIMAGVHTPPSFETYRNYNVGACISVQLANCLAELGYQATANHLRHYEVLCVPLAVDAGLGELGRNGYLITKEFGPRVRLVVVTTDAPLAPDRPVDLGVQHFCQHCKKCAHLCPSDSIPTGDKTLNNGLLRWVTDADSCSAWWARVGTCCSWCMAVCPWSHPSTVSHRVSKFLVTRSALARRLLAWADDLFYGNYKGHWYGQEWCDYRRGKTIDQGGQSNPGASA